MTLIRSFETTAFFSHLDHDGANRRAEGGVCVSSIDMKLNQKSRRQLELNMGNMCAIATIELLSLQAEYAI